MLVLVGCLLLWAGRWAQSAGGASPRDSLDLQMLSEQEHFMECLSCVYSPAWWLSYNGSLYFQPRNEAQAKQLESMKAARSGYLALTNQVLRHELTARLMAESGISEAWQRKILLPLSATNQTLTPTLNRPVRVVPRFTVPGQTRQTAKWCDTRCDIEADGSSVPFWHLYFCRYCIDECGCKRILNSV